MKLFYKEKINNKRIIHVGSLKFCYTKHPVKTFLLSLRLKQDKTSIVEFYLIDAFEIYHFLPIYKELLKQGINSRIVAEPCEINSVGGWFDYKTAIKILKDLNIDYCTKCNPNAKISITTQKADVLCKYQNLKVNFSYGFGFTKNYFINSKDAVEGFDIKFVHGSYPKKIIEKYRTPAKVVSFGYPKYQKFLENPPSRTSLLKDLKINTNKQIITYFPTWDEDSSIQKFSEVFNKLREKYFIITKPHHCTFRLPDKKSDLEAIYRISDLVLDGNYDFAKATMLGDIAVCDIKSGSSCEVPYLNKSIPVILLTPFSNLDRYNEVSSKYFEIVYKPSSLISKIKDIENKGVNRDKIDSFINEVYENIPIQKTVDFLIDLTKRSK